MLQPDYGTPAGSPDNPIQRLQPLLVYFVREKHLGRQHDIRVLLGTDSIDWHAAQAVGPLVKRILRGAVCKFVPNGDTKNWTLEIYAPYGFTPRSAGQLLKLIKPRYTGQALANAETIRRGGVHSDTNVALAITWGLGRSVSPAKLNALPGVQQARFTRQDGVVVVEFSLVNPHDDVQSTTNAVAEAMKLYLAYTVRVYGVDPQAPRCCPTTHDASQTVTERS